MAPAKAIVPCVPNDCMDSQRGGRTRGTEKVQVPGTQLKELPGHDTRSPDKQDLGSIWKDIRHVDESERNCASRCPLYSVVELEACTSAEPADTIVFGCMQ